MPEGPSADLQLTLYHDEDAEVFINGVPAAQASGYTSDYETIPIAPAARSSLKQGLNVLAIHCHQTGGGQYVDAGLVEVREAR